MQFAELAFVPAGNFGEVPGDPGNSVDFLRAAVLAGIGNAPSGLAAIETAGEFRRKGDLVVIGMAEGFNDEIGQGLLVWFRLAKPDVGD